MISCTRKKGKKENRNSNFSVQAGIKEINNYDKMLAVWVKQQLLAVSLLSLFSRNSCIIFILIVFLFLPSSWKMNFFSKTDWHQDSDWMSASHLIFFPSLSLSFFFPFTPKDDDEDDDAKEEVTLMHLMLHLIFLLFFFFVASSSLLWVSLADCRVCGYESSVRVFSLVITSRWQKSEKGKTEGSKIFVNVMVTCIREACAEGADGMEWRDTMPFVKIEGTEKGSLNAGHTFDRVYQVWRSLCLRLSPPVCLYQFDQRAEWGREWFAVRDTRLVKCDRKGIIKRWDDDRVFSSLWSSRQMTVSRRSSLPSSLSHRTCEFSPRLFLLFSVWDHYCSYCSYSLVACLWLSVRWGRVCFPWSVYWISIW